MTKHVKMKENMPHIFVIMGCQIICKVALDELMNISNEKAYKKYMYNNKKSYTCLICGYHGLTTATMFFGSICSHAHMKKILK